MKKFLIISAVFIVLVLGLVAQHHHVDLEEAQVVPNTVESIQPRLTKSEKIEANYQSSQDPIGEIPVIFEQIVASDSVKPTEKSPVVASQPTIVPSTTSPKTEPNMNESMNLLAGQVAEQMMPMMHTQQLSPDMGMYPVDVMANQYDQSSRAIKPVESSQPQELLQNQVVSDEPDESLSSRRLKKSHHVSPESYQSASANIAAPVVTPVEQHQVAAPMVPEGQPVAQSSLFGRVKNGLSKVPKWLCGLPLIAGAYALMKKAPEVEVSVKPESERIDVAGHVHDKLQELQDEYLKKQAESDQQPTPSPEASKEIASVAEQVPAKEAQPQVASEIVAPEVAPESIEPMSSSVPAIGGMLSSTRKLLSPVRSFDQLPEVSVPVVETAIVPVMPAVSVVAQEQGAVRKAMSDCYGYFAKRLSSPIGVLALATKAAAIGMQIAPLAYAARQAQVAHAEDMMLEGAIAQVARTMKPLELPMVTSAVTPVEGAIPSYVSQLAAGNASTIAGQLAAQCATLRLR